MGILEILALHAMRHLSYDGCLSTNTACYAPAWKAGQDAVLGLLL
jgi:hypothetical protein